MSNRGRVQRHRGAATCSTFGNDRSCRLGHQFRPRFQRADAIAFPLVDAMSASPLTADDDRASSLFEREEPICLVAGIDIRKHVFQAAVLDPESKRRGLWRRVFP